MWFLCCQLTKMIRGLEYSDLQVEGGSCASEQKSIRCVFKSVRETKREPTRRPSELRTHGVHHYRLRPFVLFRLGERSGTPISIAVQIPSWLCQLLTTFTSYTISPLQQYFSDCATFLLDRCSLLASNSGWRLELCWGKEPLNFHSSTCTSFPTEEFVWRITKSLILWEKLCAIRFWVKESWLQ